MTTMEIVWKRLVKGGETCVRCGDTGRELETAVSKLTTVLGPLGIVPVLETQELSEDVFRAEPSESNRVWIAGRPVEAWLGAEVGMSRFCSVCGDSDCRTLEVAGRTYEMIPEALFIKAGLIAASQMMTPTPKPSATSSCCNAVLENAACRPVADQTDGGCCSP